MAWGQDFATLVTFLQIAGYEGLPGNWSEGPAAWSFSLRLCHFAPEIEFNIMGIGNWRVWASDRKLCRV